MSSVNQNIERGRSALTTDEARRLRTLLEDDEAAVISASGMSRTPLYRAAAALPVQSATRYAIRSVLLTLAAG